MAIIRNKKTVEELKKEQGDLVHIIRNPKTNNASSICSLSKLSR